MPPADCHRRPDPEQAARDLWDLPHHGVGRCITDGPRGEREAVHRHLCGHINAEAPPERITPAVDTCRGRRGIRPDPRPVLRPVLRPPVRRPESPSIVESRCGRPGFSFGRWAPCRDLRLFLLCAKPHKPERLTTSLPPFVKRRMSVQIRPRAPPHRPAAPYPPRPSSNTPCPALRSLPCRASSSQISRG